MDSDNESHSDFYEEIQESPIDIFISKETDYIMDIYHDIQDRIPYFLDKSRFPDFMNFIIDNKFGLYENTKRYNSQNIDYFYSEYKSEIDGIFYVINQYLTKYKNFALDYDIFVKFAFEFTTWV